MLNNTPKDTAQPLWSGTVEEYGVRHGHESVANAGLHTNDTGTCTVPHPRTKCPTRPTSKEAIFSSRDIHEKDMLFKRYPHLWALVFLVSSNNFRCVVVEPLLFHLLLSNAKVR